MSKIIDLVLGHPLDRLHKESGNVLDIFTETTNKLKDLNVQIAKHTAQREEEQKRIVDELSRLASLRDNHDKVINKIAKIFE